MAIPRKPFIYCKVSEQCPCNWNSDRHRSRCSSRPWSWVCGASSARPPSKWPWPRQVSRMLCPHWSCTGARTCDGPPPEYYRRQSSRRALGPGTGTLSCIREIPGATWTLSGHRRTAANRWSPPPSPATFRTEVVPVLNSCAVPSSRSMSSADDPTYWFDHPLTPNTVYRRCTEEKWKGVKNWRLENRLSTLTVPPHSVCSLCGHYSSSQWCHCLS